MSRTSSEDAELSRATVVIDGIEFRISVPKPIPGSRGATVDHENVIITRCGLDSCNRINDSLTKIFCSDECRTEFHNQRRFHKRD
jgi:hypothetical protein